MSLLIKLSTLPFIVRLAHSPWRIVLAAEDYQSKQSDYERKHTKKFRRQNAEALNIDDVYRQS